ncbi:MAG: GNAT family protein [bacterium]|nr:GNAT family protein [bacterium]
MNVQLKKWSLDDRQKLMDICNHTERRYIADGMSDPYTEADAKLWLKMVTKQDGKAGIFRAIIVDDQYIGNISVIRQENVCNKDGEIGYILMRKEWSKGIATKAVHIMCKEAFDQLDIIRISGIVYSPNIASIRVLEKNGFTLEGIVKKGIYKNGQYYDKCIFGLLKE